ncbi:conserved hypothetical protein [Planktothrix serta PCC 8927]|uniref:Rhodanese domain-containing protein n=1 Tax=Planktothrix serta PCC 8927 TaxID=671068 RepID=A0A7Z9BL57_9CYAN|nr:rhodanese-like domain-containing protein [Planktothrix serta]VXD16617.1 conserved hypothetical protein [Planktothrix serta PCC 8927]
MFSRFIPKPPPLAAKARVYDLKTRLDWGEPALTIIDVRDLNSFNHCHIQGAIRMPLDSLPEQVLSNLELNRDIYIYGESDEKTAEAAAKLREVGFKKVAELIGGLAGWQAVGYPVEAISAVVG